jgi:hypothetical protein
LAKAGQVPVTSNTAYSDQFIGAVHAAGIFAVGTFLMRDSVVSDNIASVNTTNDAVAFEGGMSVAGDSVVIRHSVIRNNKAMAIGRFLVTAGTGGIRVGGRSPSSAP